MGHSLHVLDRSETNAGVAQSVSGLTPNQLYEISFDAKAETSQSLSLQLSVGQTDENEIQLYAGASPSSDSWRNKKGIFRLSTDSVNPVVYLRGSEADINFYVDSFSVKAYQRETEKVAISNGKNFYADKGCSSCHGSGVNDTAANVVINPRNLKETTRANLAMYIHANMPKGASQECEAECAISIAAYLMNSD